MLARLAIDVRSGSVFCAPCDDLIYNHDLESISRSIKITTVRKRARIGDIHLPSCGQQRLMRFFSTSRL